MYQLYDFASSGNGYKVRLLLTQLELPFTYHECNILDGATRTPEFLALNPNGKIPLLITPDRKTLSESNAIICYLAEGTRFMPADAWERAQVLQWMFWEQYSHEPYIATSRFWKKYCDPAEVADKLAEAKPKGIAALDIMETHLEGLQWFVGETYTIADITLYAYTHTAEDGGFSLREYPNIRSWLARVKAQPLHRTISEGV
jgi:glutathione S-transferase